MSEDVIVPFERPHELSEVELQLRGYRLATAEILYHLPDFPDFLQTFLWQDLDLAPRFPVLRHFLDFWQTHLDGKLHSVTVACAGHLNAGEIRAADGEFHFH